MWWGVYSAEGGEDHSRPPPQSTDAWWVRTRGASRRAGPTLVELPLTGGVRVAARAPSVSVMEAKKRGVVVRNVVKTGLPKRGALRYAPAMDAAGRGADSSGVSVTGAPRWCRRGVVARPWHPTPSGLAHAHEHQTK